MAPPLGPAAPAPPAARRSHRSSGQLFSQPRFFSKSGSSDSPNTQQRPASTTRTAIIPLGPLMVRARSAAAAHCRTQHRPGSQCRGWGAAVSCPSQGRVGLTLTQTSRLILAMLVMLWLRSKLASWVAACLHLDSSNQPAALLQEQDVACAPVLSHLLAEARPFGLLGCSRCSVILCVSCPCRLLFMCRCDKYAS